MAFTLCFGNGIVIHGSEFLNVIMSDEIQTSTSHS